MLDMAWCAGHTGQQQQIKRKESKLMSIVEMNLKKKNLIQQRQTAQARQKRKETALKASLPLYNNPMYK